MGIASRIFGDQKIFDAARDSIDAAVFTPQEKADRFERYLELYNGFKVAQRLVASIILPPYAIMWLVAAIQAAFGVSRPELYELLSGDYADMCRYIAMFYFGGGTLESAGRAVQHARNKNPNF